MSLLKLWNTIELYLFPALEEDLGEELSKKEREFIRVCTLAELDEYMDELLWRGTGRKSKDRLPILKAFVAKAVYNLPTTRSLINYLESAPALRRLCGWEMKSHIPHESKFSRVFDKIAELELPQKVHEGMIKKQCKNRIIGHINRDSTAINGREKVVKATVEDKGEQPVAKKRGRPKNGEERPKEQTKVEIQSKRTLDENLKDMPTDCNKGTKKNSNGYKVSWKGYKLHLDCIDGDIPISAILTSASMHDSQAAIPLAQMSAERVTNLYDLMDAAYDSSVVHEFSKGLGHVPIIDHNKRRGEKKEFDPAKKIRYRERSGVERVNSNLKDNYGGNTVRVKGHKKVMAHLMFGVIAVAANQLFNLLC